MTQSSSQFVGTHTAPSTGTPTWPAPGNASQGPRLDPLLPVQLVARHGDWAQIMCSNGWSAWVDGRVLVPLVAASPTQARTSRIIPPSKATLAASLGAATVGLSTLLPWIDVGGGVDTVNALDVPFVFLFGRDKLGDGGPGLGLVLLVVAAAAFLLKHVRGAQRLAALPGAVAIPMVVMFLVQINSLLSAVSAGASKPSLFDVVGIGAWVGLVGAAVLGWGAKR